MVKSRIIMGIACGVAALQLAPHGHRVIAVLLALLATFLLMWGTADDLVRRLARTLPFGDQLLACLGHLDRLISPMIAVELRSESKSIWRASSASGTFRPFSTIRHSVVVGGKPDIGTEPKSNAAVQMV